MHVVTQSRVSQQLRCLRSFGNQFCLPCATEAQYSSRPQRVAALRVSSRELSTGFVQIDLGKHSFHLHSQDKPGRALFRKKLSCRQMRLFGNLPACTVVMKACAGAHFVARKLAAMGHKAKLISRQFVRPFVKGNKNDFGDAEAICEAASRPSMRFCLTQN